jgi:hypothetical protein
MKYKLIKEYPGSPCLGQEIDLYNIDSKICGYKYIDEKWEINKKDVINNPEFWEKIEEKLCVPIGIRFIHKDHPDPIYNITKLKDNKVYLVKVFEDEIRNPVIKTYKEFNEEQLDILVEQYFNPPDYL